VLTVETTVLQAHPHPRCYNTALLDAVVDGLRAAGRSPQVVGLGEQQTLAGGRLAVTEHLVVVYPTWWGAPPAILQGWLQAVCGPWVDDGRSQADSPWRTIRRLSAVTTHGSSRLVNRVQGEPGLCMWKRTVLPLCAPGAVFDWQALYKIDRLDEAERLAFIERVRALFAMGLAGGVTSG